MATALALWFQYSLGPAIATMDGFLWDFYRWVPGIGKTVYHAWYDSCEVYDHSDADEDAQHLLKQCAGNAGVFRPMFVAFLFFVVQSIATYVQAGLNREAWPAKFAMYLILVAATVFFNNSPWYTGVFLWIARFGATIFLLIQQVILIDIAYDWNEDWIDRADQQDRLTYGSGSTWLHAIVGTCVAFYLLALTGIGMLYHYFSDCSENTWIITLTLIGMIAFTAIQLSGTDGSLLTSSIMSVYVVYLAYSMVSKNPDGQCNPQLGGNDTWGIAIGLTLTAVSLAWTGFSWTAEERLNVDNVQSARSVTGLNSSGGPIGVNLDQPFLDPEDQPATGLVTESDSAPTAANGHLAGTGLWKLNVVMALICCFVAMILTGWGTITVIKEDENNAANPTVGRVNMAMIGISQWTAILLYVWTLVAPRMFPDRDFS
eukprot:CAMPEP_0172449528 /NCGR_PEP_ID=MMETSP1065-20121228/8211_1 /TAXON_ID=265537 /ORGANISM="Amphiprora paludosa, Strain CCMP125" /LENGTH=429 /DNA_ID=CAMNT_0013201217 /DNA_START=183 /DNA_END=1472 /DNA_ORIENTATION=+